MLIILLICARKVNLRKTNNKHTVYLSIDLFKCKGLLSIKLLVTIKIKTPLHDNDFYYILFRK